LPCPDCIASVPFTILHLGPGTHALGADSFSPAREKQTHLRSFRGLDTLYSLLSSFGLCSTGLIFLPISFNCGPRLFSTIDGRGCFVMVGFLKKGMHTFFLFFGYKSPFFFCLSD